MKAMLRLAEERWEFMHVAFKVKERREKQDRAHPAFKLLCRDREGPAGRRGRSAASLCKLKVSATLTSIPVWA